MPQGPSELDQEKFQTAMAQGKKFPTKVGGYPQPRSGLGQDPDERYMRKMENKYVEEPARQTARRTAERATAGYGSRPVKPTT